MNKDSQTKQVEQPAKNEPTPVKGDDVISKEGIKQAWAILHDHVDPHCFLKDKCYEAAIDAMEEYASQFAAPQAVKWVQADWKEKFGEWYAAQDIRVPLIELFYQIELYIIGNEGSTDKNETNE